jgi:hypothetical protein
LIDIENLATCRRFSIEKYRFIHRLRIIYEKAAKNSAEEMKIFFAFDLIGKNK